MLRIAEQWHGSDVGRQRQGNEDSFFVRSPVFVVADGMGGAQAGEVASKIAVEAFEPEMPDGGGPEAALTEIIQAANNRIHEMSHSDRQYAGMGTTCTAVYLDEREIVLAHVGDSRCYLYRNGELTRLTTDHSLVGELMDRGKLTEEQAELHPQRSVITRALGPERDVRVDTERVEARSGDVFLLCSDGLTSMVREAALVGLLEGASSLEQAGRGLIAAANEAGGRDNITVILLRLEEVDTSGMAGASETQVTSEGAAVEDVEATTADPEPAPRPAGPAASAPPPGAGRVAGAPAGRRRRFPVKGLVVALVLLAILAVSAFVATRAVFFAGVDERTQAVTVYRGLPFELPGGIELYTTHYTSGVTLEQVPPSRRATFTENKLRSLDDASDLVRQLELGKLSE